MVAARDKAVAVDGKVRARSRDASPTVPPPVLAQMRNVRDRLDHVFGHRQYAIAVSGCERGAGTTFIATALAACLAEDASHSTVLVDADQREPALRARLGLSDGPGLADLLDGGVELDACTARADALGCVVVPAAPGHGTELVADASRRLVNRLRQSFDRTIFDCAPVLESSDPLNLAREADGLLLVLAAERTRQQVALQVKQAAEAAGVRVIGSVLNRRRFHVPGWLYHRL